MNKIRLLAIMVRVTGFASWLGLRENGIRVEITGVENEDGQVFIGLFNKQDGFPDKGSEYNGVFVKAKGGILYHAFIEIPGGEYAIAIFHDSNANEKLDKNFLGIPKEGYGFSNNATATFGPPSFEKAKFEFNDTYTAQIQIGY